MREFINIILEAEEESTSIDLRAKDEALDARLTAFMEDLWQHTHPHPWTRGARLTSNAIIECRPLWDTIRVSSVQTVEPKSGGGKEAMELLCALADKHQVVLTGTAKKFGTDKSYMTTKSLKAWYPRFGFKMGRGNAQDGYDMRREPQAPGTVTEAAGAWDPG